MEGGGGGDCVPQQEEVPQRPSQLQAQPCLLRCTWGGTNNHQIHYKLLGVPGAGTNNHQFHCKLGKILPLLVSHCWMSSIMVLRNMIQQHIQSVLFNQSSLDFCCLFHEDFLELPGTDVYLLRLGAPVKLSNCSNRKCSFFLLRILFMSHVTLCHNTSEVSGVYSFADHFFARHGKMKKTVICDYDGEDDENSRQ